VAIRWRHSDYSVFVTTKLLASSTTVATRKLTKKTIDALPIRELGLHRL
jgi:hypothetical protein